MEFEFDPTKSVANKAKHGIDFEEAQALWSNEDLAVAPSLACPDLRGDRENWRKDLDGGLHIARRSCADHFRSSFAAERGESL